MQPIVLFSSVGRRAQLIECFRESLRDLSFSGGILGMDCSKIAPAAYLVDEFFHVPRCTDPRPAGTRYLPQAPRKFGCAHN